MFAVEYDDSQSGEGGATKSVHGAVHTFDLQTGKRRVDYLERRSWERRQLLLVRIEADYDEQRPTKLMCRMPALTSQPV